MNEEVTEEGKTANRNVVIGIQNTNKVMGVDEITGSQTREGNKNEELAATAKSLQSCPTLCDPIDGSPPGSPIPGILQARVLEWGAIAFSDEDLKYTKFGGL